MAVRDRTTPAAGLGLAMSGTLLIAATYGMARFGVGLFAPRLVAERPGLADAVGLAAAAQFVSYSLAAAVAALTSDRPPRTALVLAGATATLGCLGVAVATTPAAFVGSVFIGGMGAGFASPALVRVVDDVVVARLASTAQSLVNAGTAVGVVAAGILAFLTATSAPAWRFMAVVCASSALAVLALARRRPSADPGAGAASAARAGARGRWSALAAPALSAFVVGAGSALIWTYGPLLVTRAGPIGAGQTGFLWIALGLGGLLGPLTGRVVDHWGTRWSWRLFAGVLVLANVALAVGMDLGEGWAAYGAMALFGAGYMCLSGVLILWARTVWPDAAGAGTSLLFIALACGQAVASLGFEVLHRQAGPTVAVLIAAALCAVGALTSGAGPTDGARADARHGNGSSP